MPTIYSTTPLQITKLYNFISHFELCQNAQRINILCYQHWVLYDFLSGKLVEDPDSKALYQISYQQSVQMLNILSKGKNGFRNHTAWVALIDSPVMREYWRTAPSKKIKELLSRMHQHRFSEGLKLNLLNDTIRQELQRCYIDDFFLVLKRNSSNVVFFNDLYELRCNEIAMYLSSLDMNTFCEKFNIVFPYLTETAALKLCRGLQVHHEKLRLYASKYPMILNTNVIWKMFPTEEPNKKRKNEEEIPDSPLAKKSAHRDNINHPEYKYPKMGNLLFSFNFEVKKTVSYSMEDQITYPTPSPHPAAAPCEESQYDALLEEFLSYYQKA